MPDSWSDHGSFLQYELQLDLLRQRELARFGDRCPPLPIDMDDVSAPLLYASINNAAQYCMASGKPA